jgi:hypothetical protein
MSDNGLRKVYDAIGRPTQSNTARLGGRARRESCQSQMREEKQPDSDFGGQRMLAVPFISHIQVQFLLVYINPHQPSSLRSAMKTAIVVIRRSVQLIQSPHIFESPPGTRKLLN